MKFLADPVKYSIFFLAISLLNYLEFSSPNLSVIKFALLPLCLIGISPSNRGLLSLLNIIRGLLSLLNIVRGLSLLTILKKSLSNSLLLLQQVTAKSAALLLWEFLSDPKKNFFLPVLSIEATKGFTPGFQLNLLRRLLALLRTKINQQQQKQQSHSEVRLTSWKALSSHSFEAFLVKYLSF